MWYNNCFIQCQCHSVWYWPAPWCSHRWFCIIYPLVCLDKLCWIAANETGIYYQWIFLYYQCLLYIFAIIFLGVTLCIQRYKRHWFLIDSGSRNPYKLVYKVIKFAKDHTNPIRRSAFTYYEDELPSRLDLGKEKYGGPFTTEQVEDVKVFLGILRVILINSWAHHDAGFFNGYNSFRICQSP